MKILIRDKDALSQVNYNKVESYLKGRGWSKKASIQSKANIWRLDKKEILVPILSSLEDYSARIYDLFETLSETENRSQLEIYNDILTAFTDVVRLRAEATDYEDGTIPVKKGISLIQGGERIFLCSAWSLEEERPYYVGKQPDKVSKFIEDLRMGQTEHGSYIATFHVPLRGIEQATILPVEQQDTPYGRKVCSRASEALSNLADAANEYRRRQNNHVFDEVISYGVNANLCESVLLLAEVCKFNDIKMDFTLSSEHKSETFNTRVVIPTTYASAIREASEYFKNKESDVDVYIEGDVIKLDKDNKFHAVVLTTSMGKPVRLHVDLTEAQHKLAIQSYEEEIAVKVSGKIKKRARFTHLEDIQLFDLIENQE